MADTPDPAQRSVWRQAFDEARALLAVAFVIAIAYNLLAATRVPWIREARENDSTAILGLGDTASAPTVASAMPDTQAVSAAPDTGRVDTAAAPAPTDTSAASARKDSIAEARKRAAATADSARNAELDAIIAKLPTVKEISTDVAKKLYDARIATFIDARPEDHYLSGHIKGAMNVYAEQWQTKIPELIKIDKSRIVVTYCGGGDECELSHDLADHMRELGFGTVVVYKGGIKEWTERKYPLSGPVK